METDINKYKVIETQHREAITDLDTKLQKQVKLNISLKKQVKHLDSKLQNIPFHLDSNINSN